MINDFQLNDIVVMKKPHACGTNEWKIIRVGVDVKIQCTACSRVIMMPRIDFKKKLKKILNR